MFKRDFKVMFMTPANQFIDPNVHNFEISKECLSKKTETHFQQYSKKCNNLMNDSCFKAKKEFDKAEQEFVKFADNSVQSNNFYEYQKNSTR